jgi:type I restriction enzyme M protein
MADHNYFSNLIWQIADLLRGPYRPPQYERVMLPMTVLRRFDCVLAPTKAKVLAEHERRKGGKLEGDALDSKLNRAAGQRFHNHSPLDFEKLKGDPNEIGKHLVSYIKGFSANVRRIFDYFEFEAEIERMDEANILYLVVSKFADVDLHPKIVPNEQMGLIFENLIRRFNELANETAGDHFTPREVIGLMVNLLFIHDDKLLATAGTVRKLLDPACGTGGMLAEAQRYLREHHAEAKLYVYGQDYNKRAFATAASDMLIKEVSHNGGGDNVRFGDSFTEDQFQRETFDYFLSNPPFGVDWKKQQKEIQAEHDKRGLDGRFATGSRLDPAYVDALVRLPVFAQEVTRYSKGVWSSRLRLYPEGFFEVHLPVPPLEEQSAIVKHIARETAKLDAVRLATKRTIALLKERRAALITAAVTGQIDVMEAAA